MSNVDMIVDKLCQDTGLVYDNLDNETKLYLYAKAMQLDLEGVKIELTIKQPPQKHPRKPN